MGEKGESGSEKVFWMSGTFAWLSPGFPLQCPEFSSIFSAWAKAMPCLILSLYIGSCDGFPEAKDMYM